MILLCMLLSESIRDPANNFTMFAFEHITRNISKACVFVTVIVSQ